MKKLVALVLSIILAVSVAVSAAAVSPKAINRVNTIIPPGGITKVGTPLSMESGETITINCTYSPRNADADFGLITPNNTFVFVEGKNGDCNHTVELNKTGSYYFAVRNNTTEPLEVLGYVYY